MAVSVARGQKKKKKMASVYGLKYWSQPRGLVGRARRWSHIAWRVGTLAWPEVWAAAKSAGVYRQKS